MVWEAGHRRREFLKLAAFSLAAAYRSMRPQGLYQAQRDTIQRPGHAGAAP